MTTDPKGTSAPQRSAGRGLLWVALGLVVLSVVLCIVQYSLGRLMIPWYLPGLTTLAALLVLVSLLRWRTVVRIVLFLLLAALAGMEWHFLLSAARLPDYAGPGTSRKDAAAVSDHAGLRRSLHRRRLARRRARALIFYRGRW